MTLAQATGKRIQELLFERKITQYRLAKNTCLSEKTIGDLTKGKNHDVKLSTIYLVADSFGLTLTDFFTSPFFDENDIEI